jgi:hypothetical protein
MAYMRCSKGKQNGGQHVEGTQWIDCAMIGH